MYNIKLNVRDGFTKYYNTRYSLSGLPLTTQPVLPKTKYISTFKSIGKSLIFPSTLLIYSSNKQSTSILTDK